MAATKRRFTENILKEDTENFNTMAFTEYSKRRSVHTEVTKDTSPTNSKNTQHRRTQSTAVRAPSPTKTSLPLELSDFGKVELNSNPIRVVRSKSSSKREAKLKLSRRNLSKEKKILVSQRHSLPNVQSTNTKFSEDSSQSNNALCFKSRESLLEAMDKRDPDGNLYEFMKNRSAEELQELLRLTIPYRDRKASGETLSEEVFVGKVAVDLIVSFFRLESRYDAINFLQKKMDEGLIVSVNGSKKFLDKKSACYQFSEKVKYSSPIRCHKQNSFIGELEIKSMVGKLSTTGYKYVKIFVDNTRMRTRNVRSRGGKTCWNQCILAHIFHSHAYIEFQVWTRNLLGKDIMDGKTNLFLSSPTNTKETILLDLHRNGSKVVGQIALTLKYRFLHGTKDIGATINPLYFPKIVRVPDPTQIIISRNTATKARKLSKVIKTRPSVFIPNHRCAVDTYIIQGEKEDEPVRIKGYFKWGHTHLRTKDGDTVELFIQNRDSYIHTGEWKSFGTAKLKSLATQYVVNFYVDRKELSQIGRYRVVMVVHSDLSIARGSIWVVARNTKAVCFDIDGTLTVSDGHVVTQLLLDVVHTEFNPSMRNGAAAVCRAWYAKGYLPIYLSGRAGTHYNMTIEWLHKNGFPPGLIGHTSGTMPTLPIYKIPGSGFGVGTFKYNYLRNITSNGLILYAGYGNTATDIRCYKALGLKKSRIYTSKTLGVSHQDTVALGSGFVNHLAFLKKLRNSSVPCPNHYIDF
eukprot:TRINITY_DN12897_c0_g1_i1.p1 TRINITY_DN12897_c0_g1~~TRINITY_DN12897_c0_g1_i1.p1  ORF type:complete len:745 (+),score=118.09 TRINITY_DN12897_c0_g1_i1:107-2341(+)